MTVEKRAKCVTVTLRVPTALNQPLDLRILPLRLVLNFEHPLSNCENYHVDKSLLYFIVILRLDHPSTFVCVAIEFINIIFSHNAVASELQNTDI